MIDHPEPGGGDFHQAVTKRVEGSGLERFAGRRGPRRRQGRRSGRQQIAGAQGGPQLGRDPLALLTLPAAVGTGDPVADQDREHGWQHGKGDRVAEALVGRQPGGGQGLAVEGRQGHRAASLERLSQPAGRRQRRGVEQPQQGAAAIVIAVVGRKGDERPRPIDHPDEATVPYQRSEPLSRFLEHSMRTRRVRHSPSP